ncbi:BZ3500_MvSof-1268-A1-R1_Chr2-2g05175 [Microbotryum saponariae]|uniref:BZ3500_MvSof-1268-A1-R1_Chr2-2g05175 protein n=1 Tax=Microbotryum saponariae TaxID=289078 RepID=A0A2X0N1X5_9BASI|nr:BZ3500_MvSof-1268-A1-R1_Chr2-2g05175 [Microbotryum saponariae]SDA01002.1 BZ3501_MvSof-1269-A2-R1_Chr2-2g04849 [Microbotryum saponariae]
MPASQVVALQTPKTSTKDTTMFNSMFLPAKAATELSHELSSYVDLSALDSSSADLVSHITPALNPLAFSHAFGAASMRTQDALLDSPLGLSPQSLNASPFDLSFDAFDASPTSVCSSSPFLDTPDLVQSSMSIEDAYPSLFGSSSIVATTMPASPQWEPQDLAGLFAATSVSQPAKPHLAPTTTMSPALMSLDAELASLPALPSPPLVSASFASPTEAAATVEVEALPELEQNGKKAKFNGTRNTKKPMIDFDAPTLPKNYLVPGKTTRKRAPSPLLKKVITSGNKRARREVSEVIESVTSSPGSEGADLPEEVLSAIEEKRRSNTLAARKSRIRKADHLKELHDRIAEQAQMIVKLQAENTVLRALTAA